MSWLTMPFSHSHFCISCFIKQQNDEVTLNTRLTSSRPIPTAQQQANFRKSLESSAHMLFHASTGLPLQSSPVSYVVLLYVGIVEC